MKRKEEAEPSTDRVRLQTLIKRENSV